MYAKPRPISSKKSVILLVSDFSISSSFCNATVPMNEKL